MNFLFDLIAAQPNNDGEFHGGGKYAKKVFFALFGQVFPDIKPFAVYNSERSLDPSIQKFIQEKGIILIDLKDKSLPVVIRENQIDRLFTALPFGLVRFGLFELKRSDCRIFCTIHGLRNLEVIAGFDALSYYSRRDLKGKFRALVKNLASRQVAQRDMARYTQLFDRSTVFTVSNHTKYSILSHFPELKQEVPVYYSPDVTEFEDATPDNQVREFALENYFLLISGNRWLKNNMRSILALDSLFSENRGLEQKVVVTGVTNPEVFLSRLRNKDRFVFYDYVSEAFLKKLYENAFAFIYMTLNEGFGYPPLDAMKAGKPVLTSPFTSIPEVCGEAVLYANPYSVTEIKNRILQLTDSVVYNMLSKAGLARYEMIRAKQEGDLGEMVRVMLR